MEEKWEALTINQVAKLIGATEVRVGQYMAEEKLHSRLNLEAKFPKYLFSMTDIKVLRKLQTDNEIPEDIDIHEFIRRCKLQGGNFRFGSGRPLFLNKDLGFGSVYDKFFGKKAEKAEAPSGFIGVGVDSSSNNRLTLEAIGIQTIKSLDAKITACEEEIKLIELMIRSGSVTHDLVKASLECDIKRLYADISAYTDQLSIAKTGRV